MFPRHSYFLFCKLLIPFAHVSFWLLVIILLDKLVGGHCRYLWVTVSSIELRHAGLTFERVTWRPRFERPTERTDRKPEHCTSSAREKTHRAGRQGLWKCPCSHPGVGVNLFRIMCMLTPVYTVFRMWKEEEARKEETEEEISWRRARTVQGHTKKSWLLKVC